VKTKRIVVAYFLAVMLSRDANAVKLCKAGGVADSYAYGRLSTVAKSGYCSSAGTYLDTTTRYFFAIGTGCTSKVFDPVNNYDISFGSLCEKVYMIGSIALGSFVGSWPCKCITSQTIPDKNIAGLPPGNQGGAIASGACVKYCAEYIINNKLY
jgi:hypothetical protein